MIWAPAAKTRFTPQPLIVSRCAGASGRSPGTCSSSSEITSIAASPHVGRAYGGCLLGDVDRHRAPRDAAPAPDAPRAAELVDPGRQLVRHPLAVARLARAAHAATVDVGVLKREAGVPLAHALGLRAREVGRVLDRCAEARRADHRAVAAGEAAVGDLVPAGVLEVALKQLLDAHRVERAAHRGGRG